jgi:cobalt/nickel transport system ATP-binding protein
MNLGLPEDVVTHRVRESLELVGMSGFEDRTPHNLSFGEKKRIAIAGVLAMQPRVLVLDEPTSGLDPQGVVKIIELLITLKKLDISSVVATHDVDIVPIFADRVYLLHHGEVALEGTPEDIFNESLIEESHLRLPYIAQLLKNLKEEGYDIDLKLTVSEATDEIVKLLREINGTSRSRKRGIERQHDS